MKTIDISIIALMIACSIILSYFKFFGNSIGFDSIPAFVALLYFKDNKAAYIGALAHLLSAFFMGFQLGLPTHLAIMILMFIMLYGAKYLLKGNQFIPFIYIFVLNAVVMPLIIFLFGIPFNTKVYYSFVTMLGFQVTINYLIAFFITIMINKRYFNGK